MPLRLSATGRAFVVCLVFALVDFAFIAFEAGLLNLFGNGVFGNARFTTGSGFFLFPLEVYDAILICGAVVFGLMLLRNSNKPQPIVPRV